MSRQSLQISTNGSLTVIRFRTVLAQTVADRQQLQAYRGKCDPLEGWETSSVSETPLHRTLMCGPSSHRPDICLGWDFSVILADYALCVSRFFFVHRLLNPSSIALTFAKLFTELTASR